ncbi:SDR family NAD(P)-dependent oxidoreductase [Vineibacter terrae]|uniref:SDR family NAD(P)-dependent oxidoreductase n=1 Tax=Vineibacter terrae TaxID=2586908 RepID=UPI001C499BBA|nr:SDR family oxidoreductase [Vineibacter terrae]
MRSGRGRASFDPPGKQRPGGKGPIDLDLHGKTALVTGAHRGTGAGIAWALAREGAHVVVNGPSEEAAARTTRILVAAGHAASIAPGDVATQDGANAVVARLVEAKRDIDILVANYGTAERRHWVDADDAAWLAMYEKNVLSAVRMIRALTPGMKARGFGRVILVGTIGTTRPAARMPHYYAAKSALPAITVSLAKELGGSGVTVNLVSPGLIATAEVIEMARKRGARDSWPEVADPNPTALMRRLAANDMPNPVGRVATVDEVGDLVAFLAGSRAGFINGQNIRIDGGAVDVTV